jgi:hypothetical protein
MGEGRGGVCGVVLLDYPVLPLRRDVSFYIMLQQM